MGPDWIDDARRRLLGLRRGPAAWGYRPGTSPAVEPSALAGLAFLATDRSPGSPGRAEALGAARWLASVRGPDGSTGVSVDLAEPGWPTPMALLLWAAIGGFESERAAAARWLLATRGRAIARSEHEPIGHDGTLVGWPWVAETHSWVEPTAMALLALSRQGMAGHPRAVEGVRVLRDRAIPGGGWNLGNPVVFGTPLRPLPGPTGLALLALAAVDGPSEAVGPAVRYLVQALAETLAPASLGWGTLGLRAWGAAPDWLPSRLDSAYQRARSRDPNAVELALLLLAAGDRSPGILGITARAEEPSHA